MENLKEHLTTFEILVSKYGFFMNLENIAETLNFPSSDSVRKALSRNTLTLPTTRLPHRKEIFVATDDVATYIDNHIN